jgi:hypothetical protein
MTYLPSKDRYKNMIYRRCGRSGIKLPAVVYFVVSLSAFFLGHIAAADNTPVDVIHLLCHY